MAEEVKKREPLSLNQRHNRLLQDLSSSVSHSKSIPKPPSSSFPLPPPPEESKAKKLEGRRRLCKASLSRDEDDDVPQFFGIEDFDSPSPSPVQMNPSMEEVEVEGCKLFGGDDDADRENRPTYNGVVFPHSQPYVSENPLKVVKSTSSGITTDFTSQTEEGEGKNKTKHEEQSFSSIADFDSSPLVKKPSKVETEAKTLSRGIGDGETKVALHKFTSSRVADFTSLTDEDSKPLKGKIQGRRHLCKAGEDKNNKTTNDKPNFSVIADFDSPPPMENVVRSNNVGGNEIRDILNDLSSRMEILSIEKRRVPKTIENSSSSVVVDKGKNRSKKEALSKYTALESLSLASNKVDTYVGKENSDDDCVVMSGHRISKDVERRSKSRQGHDNSDELEILDDYGNGTVSGEEASFVLSDPKSTYKLPSKIAKMLYPHQRDGLKWLWSLHCQGKGGILGDDMGLGKTMQICGFLAGLFHSCLTKRVLIVAPKTLLPHWIKELSTVGLSRKTKEYFGTCVKAREYELQYVLQHDGILLTTYDIVRNNTKSLCGNHYFRDWRSEDDIMWDYMILDEPACRNGMGQLWFGFGEYQTRPAYVLARPEPEAGFFKGVVEAWQVEVEENEASDTWSLGWWEGHLIKNPSTQRAKSLLEISSAHRIIISGTPLQNNLKELWALFNFCCPELLGDKAWFKDKYEYAILRGNEKNASNRDKHIGSSVAKNDIESNRRREKEKKDVSQALSPNALLQELRARIQPYFLRRMKNEVFCEDDATSSVKLSKKNEIIVWLRLTSCQRQLYEAFLKSELVLSAFDGSPLAALTTLGRATFDASVPIPQIPLKGDDLESKGAAEDVLEGMDSMLNQEDHGVAEKLAMHIADVTDIIDFEEKSDVSCKISFIISLLDDLIPKGHRVLIFSQTRKMLNLIQESLSSRGYEYLRIDGTTKANDRVTVVNNFQEGNGAPIFLLTSQVGGLGLTLTKADRVIVVDPAWNPSTDNQSVDRAYRIGQEKDVIVYRLMTCGTVEEKIYRKQLLVKSSNWLTTLRTPHSPPTVGFVMLVSSDTCRRNHIGGSTPNLRLTLLSGKALRFKVFKGGLFKSATEHKEQIRYFSQQDLRELFSIPKQGFDISLTQQQLHEEHDCQHTISLKDEINNVKCFNSRDDYLKAHIKFLENLGIAGVSNHSLLFSKTAPAPTVPEEELMRVKQTTVVGGSFSRSSVERNVDGAQYAFNPKDVMLNKKKSYSPNIGSQPTEAEVKERINRLSQMLKNTFMISNLPDKGDKIRKQIVELNLELDKIQMEKRSEKKTVDLDDYDDISGKLKRVLNV
ncbi:hypothetical protein LguiA_013384 [Lonicera macranthoides]